MKYAAVVHVPGYLPDTSEPCPRFDTAHEAWQHLADEFRETDGAYEPENDGDPDGPQKITATLIELEKNERDGWSEGTVIGPTPDYDGEHDLGLAYSVVIVSDDEN